MLNLKRIYWGRQAMKLAYSALVLWLAAAVLLALMEQAGGSVAGPGVFGVAAVFEGMMHRVLAAATVPGVCLVALSIVAAVVVGRDVRRRAPGSRRRANSRGSNDDGVSTSRLTVPSAWVNGSRCRRPRLPRQAPDGMRRLPVLRGLDVPEVPLR
jgi:hypothetical protein